MPSLRGIWTYILTHPLWSAVIAGIIIVILTSVISGLAGWWRTNEPAQKPIQIQQVQSAPALTSLGEYCKRVEDLRDRFFDKEEFIKYMTDKEVEWTGLVYSVQSYSKTKIMLMIKSDAENMCYATVIFDGNQPREKLFSFHRNDKVEITGIYEEAPAGTPSIKGITVHRLDN